MITTPKWLIAVLMAGLATSGAAQPPRPAQSPALTGFLPGARQIFVLDLANTPVGEIPAGIKLLQGTLEVVLKDGVPMLKASSAAQFLIPLAQPLPADFTLEFEIVPKACCNPADLGIGEVNQGDASVHLEWDSDGQLRAVGGGGELYQASMEDFRATLPGVRTQVGVSFQGPTIKLYTNGRRLFTLDRQFARKGELRIALGGINGGTGAVYLAGLRIATGGPLIGIVQTTPQPGPRSVTPSTPPASGQPSVRPPGRSPAPTQPPPTPPPMPPPAPPGAPATRTPPPSSSGPVTMAGSTARNLAACTPGPATAPAPQMFRVFSLRVGGAPLEWLNEPNTRYLVERAPASLNLGVTIPWTLLSSTCDPSGNFVATQSGLDEQTMTSHPILQFDDIYPGVQLGSGYQYRLTRIQSDGTSGSAIVHWDPPTAWFDLGPTASVSGNTVTLSTGIAMCQVITRCDPWMVEFTVTSSTSGFSYSTRQAWKDSYDPSISGSVEGSFMFAITGVPSGTHTFMVTGLWQPDHRVTAGSVTVVVP